MDCSPPASSVHGDSPGKNPGVGCHALLQGMDLPDPGIEPRSPALQADSLPLRQWGSPWNVRTHYIYTLYTYSHIHNTDQYMLRLGGLIEKPAAHC